MKILISIGVIIVIGLITAYAVTRPTKTEDGSYEPSRIKYKTCGI